MDYAEKESIGWMGWLANDQRATRLFPRAKRPGQGTRETVEESSQGQMPPREALHLHCATCRLQVCNGRTAKAPPFCKVRSLQVSGLKISGTLRSVFGVRDPLASKGWPSACSDVCVQVATLDPSFLRYRFPQDLSCMTFFVTWLLRALSDLWPSPDLMVQTL